MGVLLTHSGRVVKADPDMGEDVVPPSIPDIGLALSRIPRFGGHTRRWWTVAHHVLWLDDYARFLGASDAIRLGVLLHDAHEAVTGDIPTHFKAPGMKLIQKDLDRAIFGRYHPGFYAIEESVKWYDREGLLAEADVVGPPALNYSDAPDDEQRDAAARLFEAYFPGVPEWRGDAYKFLWRWIDDAEQNRDITGAAGLRQEFIDRVTSLL